MDDIEFDHSAEGQVKNFPPEPDYMAMAEAEYARLFGGAPELIHPSDRRPKPDHEDRQFVGGGIIDWLF